MTQPVVVTNNLVKSFGTQTVLNGVSMDIKAGDIYGLLGKNGAGKSTLMKILLGLLPTDSGSISIMGQELLNNRNQILQNVGALIEEPSFYPNLTGFENLKLIQNILKLPTKNIEKVLQIVDLTNAKNKLVKNYSLGMKQRLGIAQALIKFPKVLILDEPTNGLDPEGIHQMRELILSLPKQYEMTILVSSHLLSEMEQMAQTVGILHEGKLIYQGPMQQLMQAQQYRLRTDNLPKTAAILQDSGMESINQVKRDLMFEASDEQQIALLVRQLVQQNIDVYALYQQKQSLEDIFLKLTGGTGK